MAESLRVLVADDAGAVVGHGSRPLASQRAGGRHEQDPGDWWRAFGAAFRQALRTAPADRIGAVAICGTSGTFLLAGRRRAPHAGADVRRRTGGIRLLALGGEYYPTHDSFLGVPCVEAIEALRVDTLFASTSATSGSYAYHQEQEIVLVRRAMIRAAQHRALMVDHTKLGRASLHRVAPLAGFDLVVTDAKAPEEALTQMRERGVRYDIA